MTSLQEYDLKITLAQIVRGQGLCKLVADSVEEQHSQINVLTGTVKIKFVVHKLLLILGLMILSFI